MKHTYPQLVYTAFGVFALSVVFAFASIAQASDITPDKVVELVNQDRVSQGFQSLRVNTALTQAAQAKADDMAKNAYFAHTSPNGVTPWYWIAQRGYDYRFAGENLAIHFTDAESQEKAWMESIKHRENILNPKYQDIGVAVENTIQNGKETIIVVQMFGLLSGVAIPVKTSNTQLQTQTPVTNELVPSSSSLQQQPASKVQTYDPSASRSDGSSLWLQWAGFLIVLIIAGAGLSLILMNRRILYYRWFHRDHIFKYRG